MFTVLVVDDEPDIVDILTAFIEDSFDVKQAVRFEEAISILGKEEVHLVLSDLNMPGVSPDEIVGKIHAVKSGLPIVIMSGHSADSVPVQNAISLGASGAIEKPFKDPGEIIEILQDVLEGKAKQAS